MKPVEECTQNQPSHPQSTTPHKPQRTYSILMILAVLLWLIVSLCTILLVMKIISDEKNAHSILKSTQVPLTLHPLPYQ